MTGPYQHGFVKVRSCTVNLISFYDKTTCPVDEEKVVDVVYPDLCKAFDIVSHGTLKNPGCSWLRWAHTLLGKALAE